MKTLLLSILISLPFFANTQSNPFLQFDAEEIFLGKVKKGEKVDSVFTFTNISKEDVVIDLVSTCECSEANWPKGAIKPGETAKIPFTFDSNKKDKEEEISIDVFLKNEDAEGNPVVIFLYYTYEYE